MITIPTRAWGGDLVRDKVFSLGLGVNPGESPVRCLRATVAPGDTLPLARRGMLVTLFHGWHVMNIDHTLIAYYLSHSIGLHLVSS